MAERKPEWPQTVDLAVATMETVINYRACAKLSEFGKVSQSVVKVATKAGMHGNFRREK